MMLGPSSCMEPALSAAGRLTPPAGSARGFSIPVPWSVYPRIDSALRCLINSWPFLLLCAES